MAGEEGEVGVGVDGAAAAVVVVDEGGVAGEGGVDVDAVGFGGFED